MDISLQGFRDLASATKADRDIVINHSLTALRTKYFHSASSNTKSAQTNRSTMTAFRSMLRGAYGAFGDEAFEQVLGDRNAHSRSLRAGDVLRAINLAESSYKSTAEALLQQGRYTMDGAFEKDATLRRVPVEAREALKETAFRKLREHSAFASSEAFDVLLENIKQNPDVFSHMVTALLVNEVKRNPELAPTLIVQKNNTWTETDSKALMLDPHDPDTQVMLDQLFSDFVESNRGSIDPTIKAMVAEWDGAHEDGDWAFEEDFFTFGRKYAAQLPMGIAFATDKILEDAFSGGDNKITQVAKERLELLLAPNASEATSGLAKNLPVLQKTQAQAEAKAIIAQMQLASTEATLISESGVKLAQAKIVDLAQKAGAKAEIESAQKALENAVRASTLAKELHDSATALIKHAGDLLQELEEGKAPLAETLRKVEEAKTSAENEMAKLENVHKCLRTFENAHPASVQQDLRTLLLTSEKNTCEALLAKAKALEAETLLAKAKLDDAHEAISGANDLPHKEALLSMANTLRESKLPVIEKANREATDLQSKIEAFAKRLEELSEDEEIADDALLNEIQASRKDIARSFTRLQDSDSDTTFSFEGLLESPTMTAAIKQICFEEIRQAIIESKDFARFAPGE